MKFYLLSAFTACILFVIAKVATEIGNALGMSLAFDRVVFWIFVFDVYMTEWKAEFRKKACP